MLSPIPSADLRIQPAPPRSHASPVQVLRALLLATAIAALFGSVAIRAWTQDLPEGWCFDLARSVAAAWDGAMQTTGIGRPYDWLHQTVRDWRGNP